MYAVIRKDLEMGTGKLATQAGHAFLGAIDQSSRKEEYQNGTKIVLEASLEEILNIKEECEQRKIPCYLVIDEHHVCPPHFDGSPIITALGIGPITRKEAKFLKHFKLVK